MNEKSLGQGLEALIKKDKKNNVQKEEIRSVENNFSLSDDKIEEIKEEVEKNPRISLWSPQAAACLRYLKKTIPEFSISKESSRILDNAIKEEYPEIWKLFEDI